MAKIRKPRTTFIAGNALGLKDTVEWFIGFPARIILPEHRGRRMTIWAVRNERQLNILMRDFEKHFRKGYRLYVESATRKKRGR